MRSVEPLNHRELIVLAGLVRSVVLADNIVDGEELDALARLGERVVDSADTRNPTFRSNPQGMGSSRFRMLFSEANRALPDLQSAQDAASEIEDPHSQNVIFALVSDVAHATGVGPAEQGMLDWLQDLWGLEPVSA